MTRSLRCRYRTANGQASCAGISRSTWQAHVLVCRQYRPEPPGPLMIPFGELHAEREQLQAQLDALAAVTPRACDPALLDELPLAGDILPGLPDHLKARLLEVFDIQVLWNKTDRQATVFAEITDPTLRALPALLNPDQDGYDDTSEQASDQLEAGEDLFEAPIGPESTT